MYIPKKSIKWLSNKGKQSADAIYTLLRNTWAVCTSITHIFHNCSWYPFPCPITSWRSFSFRWYILRIYASIICEIISWATSLLPFETNWIGGKLSINVVQCKIYCHDLIWALTITHLSVKFQVQSHFTATKIKRHTKRINSQAKIDVQDCLFSVGFKNGMHFSTGYFTSFDWRLVAV